MVSRFFRSIWERVAGQSTPAPEIPAVILHDPASKGPRDLDDPFIDQDVQSRIAQVIANSVEKKTP